MDVLKNKLALVWAPALMIMVHFLAHRLNFFQRADSPLMEFLQWTASFAVAFIILEAIYRLRRRLDKSQ